MAKLNILGFGIFIYFLLTTTTLLGHYGLASEAAATSVSSEIANRDESKSEKVEILIEQVFIHAYHFHTYFYQWEEDSQNEALNLRDKIQMEINKGTLTGCRNNLVNFAPRGPHLLANYETCCNATSIPAALSFFMQNHGNLSILFHPLTRWELLDHTDRAMFLGPVDIVFMNTSILSVDLFDDVDNCSEEEMEFPDPDLFIT